MEIIAAQMKQVLDTANALDPTKAFIEAIRAGEPIEVQSEQVQCYNSLQAFQAHPFVVDPDGRFEVAKGMISERKRASAPET